MTRRYGRRLGANALPIRYGGSLASVAVVLCVTIAGAGYLLTASQSGPAERKNTATGPEISRFPESLAPRDGAAPAAQYPPPANVPVGANPSALAYDSADARVFVSHLSADAITVVSASNRTVVGSIPLVGVSWSGPEAYNPALNLLYVGTSWRQICTGCVNTSVTAIDGANGSAVASYSIAGINIPDFFGCVVYDPVAGQVYACDSWTSGKLVVLNGSSLTEIRTIPVGSEPIAIAFDPTTGEGFAANWGSDDVSVFQTQSGQVNERIPVGTGPDAIVYDNRSGDLYVANNGSSNLTVIDGRTNQVTGSLRVGACPTALAYDWTQDALFVTSACSNSLETIDPQTGSVSGTVPTGDFPCGLALDPADRALFVANGGSANLSVVSTTGASFPPYFQVVFQQTGLPAGSRWTVELAGLNASTTLGNLTFWESNGTYTYTVRGVPGWRLPYPQWNGSVTVAGAPVRVDLGWFIAVYPIVFTEVGLTPGTDWTVVLGGVIKTSSFPQILFELTNGTYSCAATTPAAGYGSPANVPAQIVVNSTGVNVTPEFTADGASASGPSTWWWASLGAGAGLVGGLLVAVPLYLLGRKPSPPRQD